MSTMCHTSTLLLALLYKLSMLNQTDSCGNVILHGIEGTIKLERRSFNASIHCQWIIWPPPNSITTIRIAGSDSPVWDDSCLSILINPRIDLCNRNLKSFKTMSFKERMIPLMLKSELPFNFLLQFSTRKLDECPLHEFQCLDKSNCYNSSNIQEHAFLCKDHSDKLGFGPCGFNSTLCNFNSETCFTSPQRCNNFLDCPNGDDEVNCSVDCPGKIRCLSKSKETRCITQSQICDQIVDCSNGEDERNCQTVHSKTFLIIGTFAIFSLCSVIFICLIFRWLSTRRNVNRLLDNLPQFPLAPFQGPGENDLDSIASSDMLESDFRHGGEIYESFMQMHHIKKRTASKSVQVGMAKYSHLDLDGDNEIVVLASLNVPLEKCLGLNLSEESFLSLKSRGSPNNSSREGESKTTEDLFNLAVSIEDTRGLSQKKSARGQLKDIDELTKIVCERPSRKYSRSKSAKVRFNDPPENETVKISKSETGITKSANEQLRYQEDLDLLRNTFLGIFSDSSNQWIDIEDEKEKNRPVTTRIVKVKSARENVKRSGKRKITYSVKSLC